MPANRYTALRSAGLSSDTNARIAAVCAMASTISTPGITG
jgi:hypothetical protein